MSILSRFADLLSRFRSVGQGGGLDLKQGRSSVEQRLHQCHVDIAAITRLLEQSEQANQSHRDRIAWLVTVSLVLLEKPLLWYFLPPPVQRRLIHRRLVKKGLFNGEAYLVRYPDVRQSGQDPLRHYLRHGMNESESRINDALL